MQFAVPFTVLYLPNTHKEHAPPFGPVAPASHTHAPSAALDAAALEYSGQPRHAPAPVAPTVAEYVFTPQSRQVSFPVAPLYLPAAHRVHKLPFPLAPALHVQSFTDVLPTGELEFATHDTQLVAPSLSE